VCELRLATMFDKSEDLMRKVEALRMKPVYALSKGVLYAVRKNKRRIPARYGGYDDKPIRNGERHRAHMFLGIGANSGFFIDVIEEIRKLSPESEQRFVALEAEYWRGHHAHIKRIKQWLERAAQDSGGGNSWALTLAVHSKILFGVGREEEESRIGRVGPN